MAKVPLIPDWMRRGDGEQWDHRPLRESMELVASEEDWTLLAAALADEWNGRLLSLEDAERDLRNSERERRQRLKAARKAAPPKADG